ncbi:uncharacterized protein [Panulirus ornatus]|uniref:uncharacterized protein n=1 Tax=Panulirus ornatus TaxID=150431 RepID=UPI003A8359EA
MLAGVVKAGWRSYAGRGRRLLKDRVAGSSYISNHDHPQADQKYDELPDDMNPMVLLPLLVAGCVAAPAASTLAIHAAHLPLAAPLAVQHEVTAHVPTDVELKAVGGAVALAHPVAAAVPGYTVQGELRQVEHTVAAPEPVEVDVKSLPILAAPIAHPAIASALPLAQVKALEVPAVAPVAVAPAALTYSNLNLNVPAPVPAGDAPAPEELVQRIPVKALGRAHYSFTPQVTEVRPELKIYEKTFDVAVPKPVYETKEVTPIHHSYVPEPYAVPQPYAVPEPYNVPVPVPHPVHVQHHVAAPFAYGAAPWAGPVVTV